MGRELTVSRLTAALRGPSLEANAVEGVDAVADVVLVEEDVDAVVRRLGARRRPWALPDLRGPARRAAGAFLAHYRGPSLTAYARVLDDFVFWCAERGLDPMTVRRAEVDLWHGELEEAGRPATYRARRLSALSSFYRLALEDGLVDRNPLGTVRRPRVDERDEPEARSHLGANEARRLLGAAKAAGLRDHLLACVLVLNGLRVSEATGITVGDLGEDGGHRFVRIVRKGGRRQRVALAPRTARALDELLEQRRDAADPHVFLDFDGRPLDRFDAGRIVRRLTRRAGIAKRVSPHTLRHTFVTTALDAAVPLRDVQDAAGHADPRTTGRYDRDRNALNRSATYAVARYLG